MALDGAKLGAGGFETWGDISKKVGATPSLRVGMFAYLLLALGLAFFAILPSEADLSKALFYGALLGLVIFGVFNAVDYCILGPTIYPGVTALQSTAWGAVLCALASVAGAHFLHER